MRNKFISRSTIGHTQAGTTTTQIPTQTNTEETHLGRVNKLHKLRPILAPATKSRKIAQAHINAAAADPHAPLLAGVSISPDCDPCKRASTLHVDGQAVEGLVRVGRLLLWHGAFSVLDLYVAEQHGPGDFRLEESLCVCGRAWSVYKCVVRNLCLYAACTLIRTM